ncbi:MAG: type II secretion system protein GspK [Sedimentisphaerales bacterium]
MNRNHKKFDYNQRPGVALILTVVVLVLLTALVYRLSSTVSQWKHRMQYMIDYQTARYACESGLKYALAAVNEIEPNIISRPNEPDFSDLFNMSDEEYRLMMEEWAKKRQVQIDVNNLNKDSLITNVMNLNLHSDANDSNNLRGVAVKSPSNSPAVSFGASDVNDANKGLKQFYVRGPYGPPWPYVVKPAEIEFGDASLTIEIMDENAKLPLIWGASDDEKFKSTSEAVIRTFCEWMKMEPNDITPLMKELKQIKEVKPFNTSLKPVTTDIASGNAQTDSNSAAASADSSKQSTTRTTTRIRQRGRTRQVLESRSEIAHTMDYAKILHSPMINLESLAKPVNKDENRSESALKYVSLWGTQKVNINTAPRQVLESAFTFGGDSVEISKQIIEMRQKEPFKDVNDLAKKLYSYNTSIDKTKPYITAQSDCFMIRVKATSGVAQVCATAGIKKVRGKFQQIGIIIE